MTVNHHHAASRHSRSVGLFLLRAMIRDHDIILTLTIRLHVNLAVLTLTAEAQ